MKTIEFFFDVASPYTYLAATQIDAVGARAGAPVRWRPFLLGGVFKAVGNTPPAALAPRGRWLLADLHRWASHYGVPFRFPRSFPTNSLLAMRAIAGFPEDQIPEAAMRVFAAHWTEDRDPADAEVLRSILGDDALARAQDPGVKERLRATTDEAVARGAFGSPTILVGDDLFFGNDRMQFVEEAARA